MSSAIPDLLDRIHALEAQLQAEIEKRQAEYRYRVEAKIVRFETDVRATHRRLRIGVIRYLRESPLLSILTAPLIYGLILPLLVMDLAVMAYQFVCFPVYGIPRVRRGDYIVIDRHRLPYLNAIEALNCFFCGYANGLITYVGEVASRTEQYWCPIKHARRVHVPHHRYYGFIDYGDGEGYRRRLDELRRELSA